MSLLIAIIKTKKMSTYNEQKDYQEITPNPAFGDPKDIERLNASRRQKAEGEDTPTLEELYHSRDEIQYQMGRVPSMDKPVLEQRLEQINLKIAELESPESDRLAA
jgi:hypothetical protein